MLGSTSNESELPPSLPPPRLLSPIFMDIFEWDLYKSPSEGGVGLKRRRNSRACSPAEAPPRKDPRTGSAPPMDSRDGEDVTEGTDPIEDENATGDLNATEGGHAQAGGHRRNAGPRTGALEAGSSVQSSPSPNAVVGTASNVSVCPEHTSRDLIVF
jgi:hypothetical protein